MLLSFNLIDTFFVSLLGTDALAAISFTFPVTFTITSLAIGLGIGVSAVVARTLGKDDKPLARRHATAALLVSAILIFSLAMVTLTFIDPLFRLLGANDEHLVLIRHYLFPWFIGCLPIIMPMIGNSVMRAAGDTKTPAKVMALMAVINAILDPIFIFGWGPVPAMHIQGAAIASVLAGCGSTLLVGYRLVITNKMLGWGYAIKDLIDSTRQLMTIALPAAGANMMTPVAASILTAIIAPYGSAAVAGFGVGTRLEAIAVLVVLALSMSLPPFISQNFGAGLLSRVRQAYISSIRFVMIWQAAIYVILILASSYIASSFADDPDVAEVIVLFLLIMPLGHGLSGITILSNSSLNALHKPMQALFLNITRQFVLMLPFAYVGGQLGGIKGLFIGALTANIITGILSFVVLRSRLNTMVACEERQS